MADLTSFKTKSEEEIIADMQRTYKQALMNRGIQNPNVSEGTAAYAKFSTIARELSLIYDAITIKADANMPDTAQGEDLLRFASIFGLSLRIAGGSSGNIILNSSVNFPILIPQGAQLKDPSGLRYQVTITNSYLNNEEVPISAIDTGTTTNLPAGTTMVWISPPAFVNTICNVSIGGLTGGTDDETYEGLRTRILEKIRNPPGGANWSELVEAAETSTVAVQKAFAYPCINGPATCHIAVVTAPTPTNKERDVDATVLTAVVEPSIRSVVAEFYEIEVTTAINQPIDVSFGLALNTAALGDSPSLGGGWLDIIPFPTSNTGYAAVTAVTSSTVFTINCSSNPTPGLTRICWLSPLTWQVLHANVISFTGNAPLVQVTIDTPFAGITTGAFIFPDALEIDDYATSALAAFSLLGPGEKTNAAGLLPRAYRQPLNQINYPYKIDARVLRTLTDAHDSILDIKFNYLPVNTPDLPVLVTDAPRILVPRNIGFYPLI